MYSKLFINKKTDIHTASENKLETKNIVCMGTECPGSLGNDNIPYDVLPLAFFLSFNMKLKILGQQLGHFKIHKSRQALYTHDSILIFFYFSAF